MARSLDIFIVLISTLSICEASIFYPVSELHRSAAIKLHASIDGGFGSLEETYESLRTYDILGIEKTPDIRTVTCPVIVSILTSSSAIAKDLLYALRVNWILKCEISSDVLEGVSSRLQADVKAANSLFDFYYSIASLALIKEHASDFAHLEDAIGIFRSIKVLSQSDGKWHYSSNNLESSTYAAGIALETLAGVVSLTSSEIDQSLIESINQNVVRLFDSIEGYDDGTFYFDDSRKKQSTLSTTASVVRGVTTFSSVASGSITLPGDNMLGLAKFFLGLGLPGNAKDLFYQIDSLACLENNRVSIPLILSLSTTVLSLSKNDQLKVKVSTVLGSSAPPLTVKLLKAFGSDSKVSSIIESRELIFDREKSIFYLDVWPKGLDVGKYAFVFEAVLDDHDHKEIYATGGQTEIPVFLTGIIKIDSAELAVLDDDLGTVETLKKLDLTEQNDVSLSANHLQNLRLSFQLATPLGNNFKPHQAFLKLKHESKVEHTFILESSENNFNIVLNFLRLVEKFYYMSGKYDIELTVGDSIMDNSFQQILGHIELDLPEAPEKATRSPLVPVDPYLRYKPKAEINHIFRSPEKRPPKQLSFAFMVLTLLPLAGFVIGLISLGVNMKKLPTSTAPLTFAILFQIGIGGVLLLCLLFWIKLDLFTTLKAVSFFGAFLVLSGHRILSHLASASSKLKSS